MEDEFNFEVGETVQYYAFITHRDCYGWEDSCSVVADDWHSNNTSVATVNSTGLVTVQNAGAVRIDADTTGYTNLEGIPCPPYFLETCKNPPEKETKETKPVTLELRACGDCATRSNLFIANADISAKPKVRITPFEAVGKALTFPLAVQVTGNGNNSQITLNLRKLSGTGESQFSSNSSATINITQSGNYEIKGITESSVKDNYIVEAKSGSTVLASDTFSVAKIKITRTIAGQPNPTDVTDMTTTTIVGERISLTAQVLPAGITIAKPEWTIPEKIVNDFTVAGSIGGPVLVTDFNSTTISFVWVNGGGAGAEDFVAKQVEYAGKIDNILIKGKSIFNVKRPTTSITSQGGTTKVNTVPELYLGGVTGADVGIIITKGTTTVPTGFSGNYQFVQLINGQVVRTAVGGSPQPTPLGGLDGCYPYSSNETSINDTPGFSLIPLPGLVLQYGEYDSQWTTYLMFKPSGTVSSWVPLQRLTWVWHGTATLVAGSAPPRWTLNNIIAPGNPSGSDTTEYPTWSIVQPNAGGACFSFNLIGGIK